MADNYLEKRMEEYRAGKLAPKSRVVVHAAGAKREPGEFTMAFPKMRVAVIGGPLVLTAAVADRFRGVDAAVAVCHPDSKQCTPMAQAGGWRYYPFDPSAEGKCGIVIDDVASRWGAADVVVDLRECGKLSEMSDEEARRMAALVMLHSHPDFGFVRHTELEFGE